MLKDDLLISYSLFSFAEQTYMVSIPEYVPNFYVWQVTGDGQQNEEIFIDQDSWMRMMIKEKETTDAFWRHMSYIVAQFDGLYAG